mmetsp:Transcript_66263/g.117672  ORF Transcript_66263/g.117672 Transcript_66263/m.117672 type:complete len:167 (-) Transcript_66263:956-1456(-)
MACKLRQVQCGVRPRLGIRFINEGKGFGVVAKELIPKGTFWGAYTGEALTSDASLNKSGSYSYDLYPASHANIPSNTSTVVDSEHFGNYTRFVNHSCSPNSWSCQVWIPGGTEPVIAFFTSKDVRPDEELCVDYGGRYFQTGLQCRCGAPNCMRATKTMVKKPLAP